MSFVLFLKNSIEPLSELLKIPKSNAKGNSFQFPGNKWFVIGGDAGAANEADRAYKGQIAVARIYDRALTAEEVKLLYDTLEE